MSAAIIIILTLAVAVALWILGNISPDKTYIAQGSTSAYQTPNKTEAPRKPAKRWKFEWKEVKDDEWHLLLSPTDPLDVEPSILVGGWHYDKYWRIGSEYSILSDLRIDLSYNEVEFLPDILPKHLCYCVGSFGDKIKSEKQPYSALKDEPILIIYKGERGDALLKEQEEQKEREQIKRKLMERQRRQELEKVVRQEMIESGELYGDQPKRPPIPREVVDAIYRRDGGKCVYCGSTQNLQLDHIIPFSRGGATTIENLQLLCQKCNLEKSNKIG